MRLLVVSSVWPHVTRNFEAANVVVHSILAELARSGTFELSFAYLNTSEARVPDEAQEELDALGAVGVEFLAPVIVPPAPSLRSRPLVFLKALMGNPTGVFIGYGAGERLREAIGGRAIDAVLTIWTEVGVNAASELPVACFAYHGNPDHKVFDAQHEVRRLVGAEPKGLAGAVDWFRRALLRRVLEGAHLSVLRRYRFVADVAANDVTYYVAKGVNAFYIRNMWPAKPPADWESQRNALEAANPGKIVGSVGNLSATGNSLGFVALGQEVLPALKRRLGNVPFEIHIFGGREPKPFLKLLLADPCIRLRGFVEDLDAEILSAPVFLIANNHHRFKVGHTRFLHAWSLGACVVAFEDCREAMPEIEHGRNTLLGRTAEDVADLVAQALADRDLRRRIGRGGIETLRAQFHPAAVTRILVDKIQAALPIEVARND